MSPKGSASLVRALPATVILLFNAGLLAAPLTWFPGPSLDWPLSGAATATSTTLGNLLIGGDVSYYPEHLTVTNAYWTPLPAMSSANIAGGAVANGDFIIVYGGTDGTASTSAVFGYSPSGDTPQSFPSMSVPRSYLGYAPDRSGNAYAIGGLDEAGLPLSSAERFNPDSATWSAIAGLPAPRFNFPAVFDGVDSIYIFGGYSGTTVTESGSLLRYSVSLNAWTNLASLPVPVAASAAVLGPDGKIYVAGGLSRGVATAVVQTYDPVANTWAISTQLPEGVSAAAMGVDSLGRLLLMGGTDVNSNDVDHVWRSQQLGTPDRVPVLTTFPATNAMYSTAYNSSLAATGNPQPVYLLSSGPTNMVVDYFSGIITWTPQGVEQIGNVPVTIRATNYAGLVDWNFTIAVRNPPPTTPTNVYMASATEHSVLLAWDPESPVAGAVTYGVYIPHPWHSPRGSGGGVNYQFVASTTSTNLTIAGLTPNTSYAFDVKATGPGGTSGYAGVSARTTGPHPPTNVHITDIRSTSIGLAWEPSPGPVQVARYEVVGWIGGLFPTIEYGSNYLTTSATITGLTPGTYEEWSVRAYDPDGNVSGFSTGVFAVNPLPAPARLSGAGPAAGGGFQFTISEGGSSLQTVLVEAATSPADSNAWVQIGAVLPTANPFSFVDTNAGLYPTRFYRVRSP